MNFSRSFNIVLSSKNDGLSKKINKNKIIYFILLMYVFFILIDVILKKKQKYCITDLIILI